MSAMAYDPTVLADWQIAAAAEKGMPSPAEWQRRLGLREDEVLPYGRVAKLDSRRILNRRRARPAGKYIEITAITPTPLGEGKTTTTLGLIEGLARRGMDAGGAIRQPSGGPSMNIKGTAAGRKRPSHPDDRVHDGPHGGHRRGHERPQLGAGRPHRALAPRGELHRRGAGQAWPQAARHRSAAGGDEMGAGFLCPSPPPDRDRPGREGERDPDGIGIPNLCFLRADGDPGHRPRPRRPAGAGRGDDRGLR